jgi:hypothetical protein
MAKGRMWELIAESKRRKLREEEKEELQKLFLRVAQQDVRTLLDEGELTKCPAVDASGPTKIVRVATK